MSEPNAGLMAELFRIESPDSTAWNMQPPLVIESGLGSQLKDAAGKRYLDLIAGFGSLPLGHMSDPFKKTLESTLQENHLIQGLGDLYPSTDKVEFLSYLIDRLPKHLCQASLSLTGSQAVETALKTAMLFTGSTGFISFNRAYHGVDLGALAVTSNPYFSRPFSGFTQHNNSVRLPFNCQQSLILEAISALQKDGRGFAGIIVEPIQGRGGVIAADNEWLQGLIGLAEKNDGILIFDEIFTGMGRTGQLLSTTAPSHLVLLGKALGGGMPLSACVGTEEVMQAWPKCAGEAMHTGTFFGHPLACRVGLATLKVISEESFLGDIRIKGERAIRFLREELKGCSKVKEVRGFGLFLAIELTEAGAGVVLTNKLREKGVLVLPSGEDGRIVSLSPALNIGEGELMEALEKIVKSLTWSY